MVFVVSETTVLSSECSMFAWLKEEVGVASSLDPEVITSLEASLVISVSSLFAELEEISGAADKGYRIRIRETGFPDQAGPAER